MRLVNMATSSLPVAPSNVSLGFPSPAQDHIESDIDLNQFLIQHPSATFIARAQGQSMRSCGIFDGAYLIVDRAVERTHNSIVVAALNGEFTCKILDLKNQMLCPGDPTMKSIDFSEEMDLLIEGVVVAVINKNLTGNL